MTNPATPEPEGDAEVHAAGEAAPEATTKAPTEARGDLFPASSPLDGSPLEPVRATPPADVEAAVTRARAGQQVWGAMPTRDRAAVLARLRREILSRAEEIASLVRKECGKPFEEAALAEVLPSADLVDYWTLSIEELLEPTPVELDALTYPGKLGRVVKEPRGVVGLVTPSSFPFALPLRTILPALLAGNAVAWKPSELSSRSALLLASLVARLVPEGVLEVVLGGPEVGRALVASSVDAVVFAGGPSVGREVAVACASRFVPCSLSLSGKDAAIVLADCDLERAARGVVWGAFMNAGQAPASVQRVYVDRAIADAFTARVVALAKELRPGVDTGVLRERAQGETARRQLEEAVSRGAEVLVGGPPDDPASLAWSPTVVRVDNEATSLLTDPTPAPVLPIVAVDGPDDAVSRANASRFALTTSVWTRRLNFAHELAARLRSGVVTINNHALSASIPAAPFTGAGESGFGVTNGPHALAELTRPRFVLEDRRRARSELSWYPYTPTLRALVLASARARGGAGFFGRVRATLTLLAAWPKRLFGR